LSKDVIFNNERKLLSSNNQIWTKLSNDLGGKIAPKSLYITLLKNRYGWQTELKKLFFGSEINEENINNNYIDSDSSLSTCSFGSRELFNIQIPYDTYRQIKPEQKTYKNKGKFRNYSVLKSNIWTDVINDELLMSHKLPCNFIYNRVKVHDDLSRSKHCIDFEAQCKDRSCGANLIGWSDSKPKEGDPLQIFILATNTKGLEHQHTTKRPLKGLKRKKIGLE